MGLILIFFSGKHPNFKLKHVYKVIQEMTCAEPTFEIVKLAPMEDLDGETKMSAPKETFGFKDPYRELCFFSILTQKNMAMTECFWKKCRNPLFMGLVASKMLDVLRKNFAKRVIYEYWSSLSCLLSFTWEKWQF